MTYRSETYLKETLHTDAERLAPLSFIVSNKNYNIDYLKKKMKENKMDGRNRLDIKPGLKVKIVLKKDQRSGRLTEGIVKDLLTKSAFHTHGIKVRLESGDVGRVKEI